MAAIALVVRAVPSPGTRLLGEYGIGQLLVEEITLGLFLKNQFLFLQKGLTKRQGGNLIVHNVIYYGGQKNIKKKI